MRLAFQRQQAAWRATSAVKRRRCSHILVAKDSLDSLGSLDSTDEDLLKDLNLTLLDAAKLQESVQSLEVEAEIEERTELVALFVGLAILFGAGIWATLGVTKAEEYFAGYLLEQSLSVDNLFVFILVFRYFKVAPADQGKVLTYGLISAAVLRLGMILIGAELIEHFQPVLLGFGGILLYSAYGLLSKNDEDEEDLSDSRIVRVCRRFLNVTGEYDGNKFFTMQDGVKRATPLLLVLAVVELSDIVFAVDSIPAVFGVTQDPFIIWTSNMWAILSLRGLYTFVATAMTQLRFLDKAVALVLAWIGYKLFAEYFGLRIGTGLSLGIVAATLTGGVVASLLIPAKIAEENSSE